MSGLPLINTPGGVETFIKSIYLKNKFQIPSEKSISVIFMERYHDLLAGTTIILISVSAYFNSISVSLIVISSIILVVLYLMFKRSEFSESIYKKISKIKFVLKRLPEGFSNNTFSILTSSKNIGKGWFGTFCCDIYCHIDKAIHRMVCNDNKNSIFSVCTETAKTDGKYMKFEPEIKN